MVMEDHVHNTEIMERHNRPKNSGSGLRMLSDGLPFFCVECPLLTQSGIRYSDLADIMQMTCNMDNVRLTRREPHGQGNGMGYLRNLI